MKTNENSLDDFLINDDNRIFTIIHGKSFRKGPLFTALILAIIGLIFNYNINQNPLDSSKGDYIYYLMTAVGIFFILAGSFVYFSKSGVDIDKDKKRVRQFVKFFLKSGSWQSFEKYPFITVLKIQKRTRYGGGFGGNFKFYGATGPSVIVDNDEFEICLLNQTHYQRITVDISTNYHVAVEKAEKLAQHLGITYTQFNPVKISDRKRRGK